MDLNELIKLRQELQSIYDNETAEYKKENLDENRKSAFLAELDDISTELKKVDELIDIYKSNDKKLIVMKLERLYLRLLSGLDKEKFNSLDEDEMFELFDSNFPVEWVFKYSLDKQEDILLDAICKNKLIVPEKVTDTSDVVGRGV